MDLGLEDKTALVIGANGGMGGAICEMLVDEGLSHLIMGVRRPDDAQEQADELRARGTATVTVQPCDLSDPASPDQVLADVTAAGAQIDFVVMAAGSSARGRLSEVDEAAWDSALNSKLRGTARFLKALIPPMVERGFGRVVLIGGLNGRHPSPRGIIGGAVNAGLANLTKALSKEVAADGVTVNLVDPHITHTGRWELRLERAMAETGKSAEEVARGFLAEMPTGKPAPKEEIAGMVAYLLSRHATSITGASIPIDGGTQPSIY